MKRRVPSKPREAPLPPQPEIKKKETSLEFSASMAGVVVVALFILTFNVQAFEIPTSSMENTLLVGDHLFVDRISYSPPAKWFPAIRYAQLKRGDVFVFLKPGEPGMHLVKRVIGIPGDRIQLNRGIVYVNGVAQREPYVIHTIGDYNPYRDDFPSVRSHDGDSLTPEWRMALDSYVENGELVVPPNSYFAMGDNRDNSLDSRYWGFVPRENVIGRPLFVYWSFETPPDQHLKTSLAERIAFAAKVGVHFIDETRWQRMFKMVR